jgi:predicted GH43/DUF377 family glycosyl hydrolase
MVHVNKLGVILRKTSHQFENEAVLNPALIKVGDTIHMFYRAVTKDNYSTIGYCNLSSPMIIQHRHEHPILYPQYQYECQGLEDPRIVEIEGIYYLTYTAFDGFNALGALATSKDLKNWDKKGIIVPKITYEEFKHFIEVKGKLSEKFVRFNDYQISHYKQDRKIYLWDKNLVFFPRKIDNKFYFLHRIKPNIQIVVDIENLEDLSLDFWQRYLTNFDESVLLGSKYPHEVSYIGSGCPPIETADGWLLIYHGVHDSINGYVYSACASLLDLKNPKKEIARLPYPLFSPEKEWELKGEVNNVCFPSGAILEEDTLYIYYGAADERIAVASLSMSELLMKLKRYTI